jgi:hypothetical protein
MDMITFWCLLKIDPAFHVMVIEHFCWGIERSEEPLEPLDCEA